MFKYLEMNLNFSFKKKDYNGDNNNDINDFIFIFLLFKLCNLLQDHPKNNLTMF